MARRGRLGIVERGMMTQLFPLLSWVVRLARDDPVALTIVAEVKHDHAYCRAVGMLVHSRYRRRLADLPASGKAVLLQSEVRRFCCHEPAYHRRTFAGRFLKLIPDPDEPDSSGPARATARRRASAGPH